MKLATFGCSWTHGILEINNGYSWPKAVAELTGWQVDNFSLAGSSLSFQTYLLDDVLKNDDYDKIIFQITTPHRLTYFDDKCNYGKYLKKDNNYRHLDITGDIYRNFICVTPGHMSLNDTDDFWKYPDKFTFANMHYKYTSKNIVKTEYNALIEYLKNKVDFLYFHNENNSIDNVPVLMDIVGDKFVADNGKHFNKLGSKWVANWILENI